MDELKKKSFINNLDIDCSTISFTCQRCCQLLRIHKTFNSINQNALNTFTQLNLEEDDDTIEDSKPYKNLPYLLESGFNANDFFLVEDSNTDDKDTSNYNSSNLNNKLNENSSLVESNTNYSVTSKLFQVLSDQSSVNHPLCEECADFIIDNMDNQLKVLEDECKVYKEFLEDLEKNNTFNTTENDVNELTDKIEILKKEEIELVKSLEDTIGEKKKIEKEIQNQHEEIIKINEETNKSWCEYNYLKKKLFDCEDEISSLDNQLKYAEIHLDKVKNTNIFASAFHIWHDGHFGTINGLRLGRLPTFNVEWSEINAAWGQVVLLLHSLAKKINLVFKRFKLIPFGNHSYIKSLDQKKDLPLFGSGGYRFMWDSKYDQAMVAFLDCLQQFLEEIEKDNPDFRLPYKIQNGKIVDQSNHSYSIKICRNSEEEWTKALKFMLTDLKWIITWVAMQSTFKV